MRRLAVAVFVLLLTLDNSFQFYNSGNQLNQSEAHTASHVTRIRRESEQQSEVSDCSKYEAQTENYWHYAAPRDGMRAGVPIPKWFIELTLSHIDQADNLQISYNYAHDDGDEACMDQFHNEYCSLITQLVPPFFWLNFYSSIYNPRWADQFSTVSLSNVILSLFRYPQWATDTKTVIVIAMVPVYLLFFGLNFATLYRTLSEKHRSTFLLHATVMVLGVFVYFLVLISSCVPLLLLIAQTPCTWVPVGGVLAVMYDIPYRFLESVIFLTNVFYFLIAVDRAIAVLSLKSHEKLFSKKRMVAAIVIAILLNFGGTVVQLITAGFYIPIANHPLSLNLTRITVYINGIPVTGDKPTAMLGGTPEAMDATIAICAFEGALVVAQVFCLIIALFQCVRRRTSAFEDVDQNLSRKPCMLIIGTVAVNVVLEAVHIWCRYVLFVFTRDLDVESLANTADPPTYPIEANILGVTGFYVLVMHSSLIAFLFHAVFSAPFRETLIAMFRCGKVFKSARFVQLKVTGRITTVNAVNIPAGNPVKR